MRITSRSLVIKDGEILMVYREKEGRKYLSIPGGGVEDNETLENAAMREVLEETCIEVAIEKKLAKFDDHKYNREHHLFLCNYVSGEPKLGEAIEKEKMEKDGSNFYQPMWVKFEKVFEMDINPPLCQEFLRDFVKQYI